MKKIYSFAVGLLMLAGFLMAAPSAHAAFNDGSLGYDCPTLGTSITVSAGCDPTSVTASPGSVVDVSFYIHNTNVNTAHNVVLHLSPQTTGTVSSQTFTGSITSSDNGSVSGSATVNLTAPASLSFENAQWYTDQHSYTTPLPNGGTGSELFTNGLNLGDIPGYGTCPRDSSGGRDVFCHQGWVVVAFRVSNTTVVTPPCVITNFNVSPSNITAGNSATLNWNSTGCSSISVTSSTGGVVSTNQNGPLTVSPSYTTTYSIIGYSATGQTATTPPVTLTVGSVVSPCLISNFSTSTPNITSGNYGTLNWNTSGCSSVTVSGPNGIISSNQNGPLTVGPLANGTNTFTIVAYNSTGQQTTASPVTIYVSTNNQNQGTTPNVTTLAATNVSGVTATLNGYINSNNNCGYSSYSCNNGLTSYYFQYGTSQYSLTMQTPTQTFSMSSGNVSAYVSNLQPNVTYYFQLIASNGYGLGYGGVLSFGTYGTAVSASVSAITSVATNVTATSARLNGIVTATQGTTGVTAHFEYGTTAALGSRTSDQYVSSYAVTNYFDTINTSPNTTYYYRIVGVWNGQSFPGATVTFTTPGIENNTVVVTRVISGTGGGSSFVSLTITNQSQNILPGDMINYVVTYQNISSVTLSNAVLNVILPTGVTFRQASQGVLTTNNTVAATLGTLAPSAQGIVTITATADQRIVSGTNFVTTATLAFTTPSKAQDSAIAYVLNTVGYPNSFAGLALFGTGFFPNSLLGWILIILLIIILILIARYFYHRANAERARINQPVSHIHYEKAPHDSSMGGYTGSNLPH